LIIGGVTFPHLLAVKLFLQLASNKTNIASMTVAYFVLNNRYYQFAVLAQATSAMEIS